MKTFLLESTIENYFAASERLSGPYRRKQSASRERQLRVVSSLFHRLGFHRTRHHTATNFEGCGEGHISSHTLEFPEEILVTLIVVVARQKKCSRRVGQFRRPCVAKRLFPRQPHANLIEFFTFFTTVRPTYSFHVSTDES